MKRGFTLIELIATIIVLSIVVLITIPVIQNTLLKSREGLLESQIKSIENVARTWGTKNNGKLEDCYILRLDDLKTSGYLENKDVINPETKEELDGCVKISFEESINQYTYVYTEKDLCNCTND